MSTDLKTSYLEVILAKLRHAEADLTTSQYLELLDKVHDDVSERLAEAESLDESLADHDEEENTNEQQQ